MTLLEATITWKNGILFLHCNHCGSLMNESLNDEEPLTASSDSHQIASIFGTWDEVSHDKDCIHVTRTLSC